MQLKIDQVDVVDPVERIQAVPNRLQKQTVDPAAYNNDTLVDSAVADFPIHIDQGLQLFCQRATQATSQQFEGRTSFFA